MWGLTGLNPWLYLIVVVAFVGAVGGGYFYGHHEGANSVKAQLADSYQAALKNFSDDAVKAAAKATADALADYRAKTDVIKNLADQLTKAQGIMNAASAKLSTSLKGGACVLSPVQRQLLECVRRPSSPGCQPAAATG